jgi:diamine N-acetyltransferase
VTERRPVTRATVRALATLSVRPGPLGLVTPNAITLAEAPYEPGARVWGLWRGEVPVGLMAMIDPRQSLYVAEGDDSEAAYLWRLMTDAAHQGQGVGRFALGQALDITRYWGCPRLVTSVADVAHSNIGFYRHHGFRPTGRIVDTEIEMVRDV